MERPRSKKLDLILYQLLYINKKELEGKPINEDINIFFLCNTQGFDITKWEAKSIENELIYDGNIEKLIDNQIRITPKGIKFITNDQGYGYLDKRKSEEDLIRVKTIEKFRFDRISFFISILALFLSILSLWLK